MKSIIELCRGLPDSESEIRERATEFNFEIATAIFSATARRDSTGRIEGIRFAGFQDTDRHYLNRIADAKAATGAICARAGWFLEIYDRGDRWTVSLANEHGEIAVTASTEELARAACALLAAEATIQDEKQ